ncbi:MAG: glucosyltransferase domain-containing protein [Lachnospiraceae bacterium]|jgi:hypothetical protein|nr:glucosyltransferase domain-containing protein [Lachnospiraceae bacterium]
MNDTEKTDYETDSTTFAGMLKHIKEYKYAVIAVFLFSLLVYGSIIFYPSLSIDDEVSLTADSVIRWMTQGRFGISVLDFFVTLNTGRYVPFLWEFLGVMLLGISSIIGSYNMTRILNKEAKSFGVFVYCAVYLSLPFVFGELVSFHMFALEMGIGLFAAEMSVMMTLTFFKTAKRRALLASLVLLVAAFSIYQALATVYIVYMVLYAYIRFTQIEKENLKAGIKDIYRKLGVGAAVTTIAAAVYFLINALVNIIFVADSGYLIQYVGWGKQGNFLLEVFYAFANVVRILFGITIKGVIIYGGPVICFSSIVFIMVSIYFIKFAANKLHMLAMAVALGIAPFTMTIILGAYATPGRMFPGIAVFMAATWFLTVNLFNKKTLKNLILAACVCVLFLQAYYMNIIGYSKYLSYNNDVAIANNILFEVEKLEPEYAKKPFVFIGAYEYQKNRKVIPFLIGTVHGESFFEHDSGSNGRMVSFLNSIGHNILLPNATQIREGLAISENMSLWPAKGSVVILDDCIVIKLSEPVEEWYLINGVK